MTDAPSPVPGPEDIRPMVAMPASNRWVWVFGTVLAIAGGLLFYTLEMRRERITAPSITNVPEDRSDLISAPPQLNVPPSWQAGAAPPSALPYSAQSQGAIQAPQPVSRAYAPRLARVDPTVPGTSALPAMPPQPMPGNAWQAQPTPANGLDRATPPAPPKLGGRGGTDDDKDERVKASRFANPSTTVPKGTVIQAVLETALDSTRAGFARAIVSRDVYSFDGTHVLIPRGSRIIGDYKSDVSLGQKRVLIQWQRLTRPDGVIIEMDSPSADPLGRAGVKGAVNNHFFERFAGTILQSALQIGGELATQRIAQNSVYIGVPGIAAPLTITPDKIQPTVTVKQGTSVSVFAARDLDFSSVE